MWLTIKFISRDNFFRELKTKGGLKEIDEKINCLILRLISHLKIDHKIVSNVNFIFSGQFMFFARPIARSFLRRILSV